MLPDVIAYTTLINAHYKTKNLARVLLIKKNLVLGIIHGGKNGLDFITTR